MACRDAYMVRETTINELTESATPAEAETEKTEVTRLLFGVDSKVQANDILQNNLSEFEWVLRNKIYPNFWGRNIAGENCLTREEIDFLHGKGCKIAALYADNTPKETEEQGGIRAKKLAITAMELGIPEGTAIFNEIAADENITKDYLFGFARAMLYEGYTPGFKANTDANFAFDREFSRGIQTDAELIQQCVIWAVAPTLTEYDRMTTTHLIHPDNWTPYAPSGITRKDIAVWQYGKDCHPINDDAGKETSFNINLVRDEKVIIEKMF